MRADNLSKLPLQERKELAKNPNTPPETLTILARDEDSDVRRGVANNPNTPPETLTILARDENSDVRWGVARNPKSTREVIQTVRAYEFYQTLNKVPHPINHRTKSPL
jgi:hypothetical protein